MEHLEKSKQAERVQGGGRDPDGGGGGIGGGGPASRGRGGAISGVFRWMYSCCATFTCWIDTRSLSKSFESGAVHQFLILSLAQRGGQSQSGQAPFLQCQHYQSLPWWLHHRREASRGRGEQG